MVAYDKKEIEIKFFSDCKDLTNKEKTMNIFEVENGDLNAYVMILLIRGYMALEDGKWEDANTIFKQALNDDCTCSEAYLGLAMSQFNYRTKKDFETFYIMYDISNNENILQAKKYSTDSNKVYWEDLDKKHSEKYIGIKTNNTSSVDSQVIFNDTSTNMMVSGKNIQKYRNNSENNNSFKMIVKILLIIVFISFGISMFQEYQSDKIEQVISELVGETLVAHDSYWSGGLYGGRVNEYWHLTFIDETTLNYSYTKEFSEEPENKEACYYTITRSIIGKYKISVNEENFIIMFNESRELYALSH